MQKLFFTALLFAALLSACKQDSKNADTQPASTTASPDLLGGYWIALDFCARTDQYGSVLETIENSSQPYSYSLEFNPADPDSVGCFNGFETWKVPLKYNADTLELVGAISGQSVYLVYDSKGSREITMFNSVGGPARIDKFIKSKANTKDAPSAFRIALNHNVFNGLFTPVGKSGKANEIQFTPGGFIQGLKDYDRYELCIGGDCFVAGDAIDIVTFSKAQTENSEKILGYRYSAQNDTLTIFNMANTNPDEKGGYTIGKLAYTFLRRKAQ